MMISIDKHTKFKATQQSAFQTRTNSGYFYSSGQSSTNKANPFSPLKHVKRHSIDPLASRQSEDHRNQQKYTHKDVIREAL